MLRIVLALRLHKSGANDARPDACATPNFRNVDSWVAPLGSSIAIDLLNDVCGLLGNG